ncbi:hypothetical protein [Gelatiniphilus marinus]|uniref:Uncharacterized protein n=1 Tax=Gelatiniphilus marinus TaxID=1759464 RepID=A0ABW5JVU7_9FLAO
MELDQLVNLANGLIKNEELQKGKNVLNLIKQSIIANPAQLKNLNDYFSTGECFMLALTEEISDNVDVNQMFSSLSYYFSSSGLYINNENLNLRKNRLLAMFYGFEPITYTVMNALDLTPHISDIFSNSGSMAPIKARDAIFRMEIADLEMYPELCQMEFFNNRIKVLRGMIDAGFFSENTKEQIIETGKKYHQKLYEYLKSKILIESEIDF